MLHIVEKPFMATQFPNGLELAIGVKYAVILAWLRDGKLFYKFQIEGHNTCMKFDIQQAINHAKKYPPPNSVGFLHKDILIVPLSICTEEGE